MSRKMGVKMAALNARAMTLVKIKIQMVIKKVLKTTTIIKMRVALRKCKKSSIRLRTCESTLLKK